jgi:hypothetical protein
MALETAQLYHAHRYQLRLIAHNAQHTITHDVRAGVDTYNDTLGLSWAIDSNLFGHCFTVLFVA